jgi:hypothetical protein
MYTVKSNESHLDQLTELFEKYRLFCDCERSPKEKSILKKLIRNEESIIFIAVDYETERVMGFVNLYSCYSRRLLQRLWILTTLAYLIFKAREFRKH